jgi:hypothetical protein
LPVLTLVIENARTWRHGGTRHFAVRCFLARDVRITQNVWLESLTYVIFLTASPSMVSARHVFRFTIGQGMAVIAALAVAFAFLPMPAAIVLSLVTLLLVLRSRLLRRRWLPISNPARGARIGCLSCYLGLLVGATLGVIVVTRYPDAVAVHGGLAVFAAAVGCGFLGALVAGIIGHLVALSLPIQPLPPPDPTKVKREALRAEIDYLERLLRQPDLESDEEVRTKLTAYEARLRRELENRAGDLSDPHEGITVDLPTPEVSGEVSQ